MRLRHIEVFHAIYTSGSITQAARLLNVSQPSVSKVLAHAEQQAGFPFFTRSGGKLTPTPEAQRLIHHVSEVFEDLARVKRVAANLREGAEGKIRIACAPALGIEVIPMLVAKFVAQNPDAYFEVDTLHSDEMRDALRESRIDIAFAFDPPITPGLRSQTLATGQFVLIAPSAQMDQLTNPTPLSSLADIPFVRLNSRGPLGQLLDSHLSNMPVPPRVVAASETYHLAKSLVARGIGVAVIDQVTARATPADAITVLAIRPQIEFQISAVSLDAPLSLLCQRFLVHAQDHMQKAIDA